MSAGRAASAVCTTASSIRARTTHGRSHALHPDTFLESERLSYRPITEADLPWLIEMRSPERVARYLGGSRLQNPEALGERLKFYIECHEQFGIGLSVMSLKSTGEQIGTSGLQPLEDTGE